MTGKLFLVFFKGIDYLAADRRTALDVNTFALMFSCTVSDTQSILRNIVVSASYRDMHRLSSKIIAKMFTIFLKKKKRC